MQANFVQLLEARKLFAVELSGSASLNVATPYYVDNVFGGARVSATIRNSGGSDLLFPITVEFYLSKDRKLDVATDERAASTILTVLKKGKKATVSDDFIINVEPGKYYLVLNIDSAGFYGSGTGSLAESNRDDNTVFSDTRIVTVFPTWTNNTLDGTPGKDIVTLQQNETHHIITVNGEVRATPLNSYGFFTFLLGASPDKFTADADFTVPLRVSGGGGNDTVITGSGNDEISGSGGKDRLYGEMGNDYLIGGGANDYLEGGAGNDTLSAGLGNDKLVGSAGIDSMLGGAGDDQLYAKADGFNDVLSGGAGADLGDYDSTDSKAGIEGVIA